MNMKIGNTTIHLNTLVRDYNEGKFPWQIKKRKRHEALQGRKEKLSEEEQREVDAYVQKHKPRNSTAYILWFLFGTLGGHRYYLRSIESGIMMALFVILFPYFTIGWWLFDFVQLSHLVETRTLDVQEKIITTIETRHASTEQTQTT